MGFHTFPLVLMEVNLLAITIGAVVDVQNQITLFD